MGMRHIEVIVDKWPVGQRSEVLRKGERAFLDAEAARILVGIGKVAYVADEDAEPQRKRRYNRRDMRASD